MNSPRRILSSPSQVRLVFSSLTAIVVPGQLETLWVFGNAFMHQYHVKFQCWPETHSTRGERRSFL